MYKRQQHYIDSLLAADRQQMSRWEEKAKLADAGMEPGHEWFRPEHPAAGWTTINMPQPLKQGPFSAQNGVFWYRKRLTIPPALQGSDATLKLGRIGDMDATYVNGEFVGSMLRNYENRNYTISQSMLSMGTLEVVVRVFNCRFQGGFLPGVPMVLTNGHDSMVLDSAWQYKVGASLKGLPRPNKILSKPSGLYNAMVAPLHRYRIKGIAWYQGESNSWDPTGYADQFDALIRSWRSSWGQDSLPFIYVQMPNYLPARPNPGASKWARLREAQAEMLNRFSATGMAVTIDVGDPYEIHPYLKKPVGLRLARIAEHVAYHKSAVEYWGPTPAGHQVVGDTVVVTFEHTGNKLHFVPRGQHHNVAIAGANKRYYWAEVKLVGNCLYAWSAKVPEPVAVRYCWANNPDGALLFNAEQLPAAPFRTDDW